VATDLRDPEQLPGVSRATGVDLAETMQDIYARTEQQLARRIARDLAAGQTSPRWVIDKLLALGTLTDWTRTLLRRLSSEVADEIRYSMLAAYLAGGTEATRALAEASDTLPEWITRAGIKPGERIQQLLDGRRSRLTAGIADLSRTLPGIAALQRMIGSLVLRVTGTHLPVLRWVDDAYKRVIAESALTPVLLGTTVRRAASQHAWEQLLTEGITGFVDKAGRRWNLATYVEMATRSGVAQAAIEGHLDRLADAGLDLVIVSNAPQECEKCRRWEGAVLTRTGLDGAHTVQLPHAITDEPVDVEIAGSVAEAILGGLLHPNCFPGHVLVSAPSGVRAADSRRYEGDLVVIHTASGNELPVTPNHPVLTPEGWIPAGLLHVGQDVLRYGGDDQRMVPLDASVRPGDEQVPTPISEVFDTLRKASTMPPVRVPASAEQFHGDGFDADVEVVFADSLLGRTENASLGEGLQDSELVLGGTGLAPLLADSPPLQVLDGTGGSGNGLMGCGHLRLTLGGAHAFPLTSLGLTPIGSVSASEECGTDSGLGTADHGSDLALRHADEVQADGFLDPRLVSKGAISPSFGRGSRYAGFAEPLADPGWADVEGGRHLARRLASEVSTDQIVKIDVRNFAGHVYNLESGDGWYVASGIVVHNCRHSLSAFLPGVTRIPQDTADPEGDAARQKLRALERKVRKQKLAAAAVIDPAAKPRLDAMVRATQKLIREHVAATKHLGIKRKPERERPDLGNSSGLDAGRPAKPPP
jgi:hypothetical protein